MLHIRQIPKPDHISDISQIEKHQRAEDNKQHARNPDNPDDQVFTSS